MSDIPVDDPLLRTLESELAEPFSKDDVHWRLGATNREKTSGIALAYIDARHVMERLDQVVGVANWQREYFNSGNGNTCCRVGLLLDGDWVWKADGAGATDVEGDKGAFSDAFKRAAVNWGVGRYLYTLGTTWVPIEAKGRSHVITAAGLTQCKKTLGEVRAGESSNSERRMMAFVQNTIRTFVTSPEMVDEYIEKNKGLLEKMSKANKATVWQQLQTIKNNG